MYVCVCACIVCVCVYLCVCFHANPSSPAGDIFVHSFIQSFFGDNRARRERLTRRYKRMADQLFLILSYLYTAVCIYIYIYTYM